MPGSFNHLVVLMLENRSFDHMLGRLYRPDNPAPFQAPPRGQSFDGIEATMANPVSPHLEGVPATIEVNRALKYATPSDVGPGHAFSSVKLQIDGPAGSLTKMSGFVASRIADLKAHTPPISASEAQLKDVMAGYSPTEHLCNGQGNYAAARVISELARNFAVCDNWHASIPGPTFPNRSFLHAGTSNGFVSNGPVTKWKSHHAPTIFNRLADRQLKAKIYHSGSGPSTHNGSHTSSFPALVYELHPPVTKTAFPPATFEEFKNDAANGALPAYSFIEPEIIGDDANWKPNDQHPVRDIRYGEDLIQKVYEAVRHSPQWNDIFLIVCYDEHGGFFDHRDPPPATPPESGSGEDGFTFNQFGVRIPAVLVSPWIPAGTVFHPSKPVDHTSVIRTICARWGLPGLTHRDAAACDLREVLSDTLRTDAPDISGVVLPPSTPENLPLNDLQHEYLELVAANRGIALPALATEDDARAFAATHKLGLVSGLPESSILGNAQ